MNDDVISTNVQDVPQEAALEACTAEVSEEDKSIEATPPEDSIESLKAEISDLRAQLAKQNEEASHLLREMENFNRLFPGVSTSDLPDEVTALVGEGVPLAAAYALYEKELAVKKAKAGEINRKNAFLSAGRLGNQTPSEFFTPDEVRAMSPRQVHENYQKIRESMKHWRNKTFY